MEKSQNIYTQVCDTCPLRTKVDVDRAGESLSVGSDGTISTLSDGMNQFRITHTQVETLTSTSARGSIDETYHRITDCESPHIGILRAKCSAGLASAAKWASLEYAEKPNVASSKEIAPFIETADPTDILPYATDGAYMYTHHLIEAIQDTDSHSSFMNMGIYKLAGEIRGTTAQLPKNKAFMLDSVLSMGAEAFKNIYRIRLAQSGPHYTFQLESNEKITTEEVIARGLYQFITCDPDTLEKSSELEASIDERDAQRTDRVRNFLMHDAYDFLSNTKRNKT